MNKLVIGVATALLGVAANAKVGYKVYDLEQHYLLPELANYLATRKTVPIYHPDTQMLDYRVGKDAKGKPTVISMPCFIMMNGYRTIAEDLLGLDRVRVDAMDEAGVDVAVLSSSPAIEDLPRDRAVEYARKSNDAVCALAQRFPGRFIGAAVLPTPYVDEAIKELERCVNDLGFKCWYTHSNYYPDYPTGRRVEYLYDDKYMPLIAKAAELKCPVYVHPANPCDADMMESGYIYSAAVLGFGQDVMRTTLRLMMRGIFDDYPDLKMAVGHLGEYYPFIMERLDNRLLAYPEPQVRMKEKPSYYLKKNIYLVSGGVSQAATYRCAINVMGVDRILYGSDFPYENYTNMVKSAKAALDETQREKVFSKNVEDFLGMAGPSPEDDDE